MQECGLRESSARKSWGCTRFDIISRASCVNNSGIRSARDLALRQDASQLSRCAAAQRSPAAKGRNEQPAAVCTLPARYAGIRRRTRDPSGHTDASGHAGCLGTSLDASGSAGHIGTRGMHRTRDSRNSAPDSWAENTGAVIHRSSREMRHVKRFVFRTSLEHVSSRQQETSCRAFTPALNSLRASIPGRL